LIVRRWKLWTSVLVVALGAWLVVRAVKLRVPKSHVSVVPERSQRLKPEQRVVESHPNPHLVSGEVLSSRGGPIAGARVCAVDVNYEAIGSPPSRCVDSDGRGAYTFSATWTGSYLIRASAIGFAPGVANQGRPVAIGGNDVRSGLDIVLEAGGAKVAGKVIDVMGGPVPHAAISIARTPTPGDMANVEADDQGLFAGWISEGTVLLTVSMSGYAVGQLFATAPSSNLTVVLIPGGTVSGMVVSAEDGLPVGDVTVRVVPIGSLGAAGYPSAVSNEEGIFTIHGVEPGTYNVFGEGSRWRGGATQPIELDVAEAVEHVNVQVHPALRVAGRVLLRSTTEPCARGSVMLSRAEDAAAVPTMVSYIKDGGRVEFDSVVSGRYSVAVNCFDNVLRQGPRALEMRQDDVTDILWRVDQGLGLAIRVLDAAEQPVPGATIRLELPSVKPGGPTAIVPFTVDANGRYDYPTMLEPGTYRIAPHGAYRGQPVTVDLREGMGKVDLTLHLDGSGSVLVDVFTPHREPVDGVTVIAMPADATRAADAGSMSVASVATDQALSATSTAPADSAGNPAIASNGAGPSPDAALLVQRFQEGRMATPLGDGRYRIGPLENGRYEVKVEDHINAPVPVQGARGRLIEVSNRVVHLNLVLDRGASIRGRVMDGEGNPVADASVSALHDSGGDSDRMAKTERMLSGGRTVGQRTLTDVNGRFVIRGLAPSDRFAVRAEQAHGSADVRPGVAPGEEVTLTLAAPGALRGTAIDEQGRPVAHFSLQTVQLDTEHSRTAAISTHDGIWSVDRIASGHLRVMAIDDEGRMAQQELNVAPGQRVDGVRLVLQRSPSLSAMLGAHGNPVSAAPERP
jgi:hypothetical protein